MCVQNMCMIKFDITFLHIQFQIYITNYMYVHGQNGGRYITCSKMVLPSLASKTGAIFRILNTMW